LPTFSFHKYLVNLVKPVDNRIIDLLNKYPFVSYIVYGGNEYIGIVQNVDDYLTTVYDLGSVRTEEEKLIFLQLGETWWWESNRLIPINVFLKQDWQVFRYVLKTMNSKDVDIKMGPYVSLKEIAAKKTKRRSITLVRKVTP
jgi:hypothetical protein